MLLTESTAPFIFKPIGNGELVESAPGIKTYRRTGVFQNYKIVNQNTRNYPESIWRNHFAETHDFANRLKGRAVVGLLEHPEDGMTRFDRGISHVVTNVHIATAQEIAESNGKLTEGDIVGTFEALNTRNGQELRALLEANIPVGVSSRGNGTVRDGMVEAKPAQIVNDDFILETWDVVFSPSVSRAVPMQAESTADQREAACMEAKVKGFQAAFENELNADACPFTEGTAERIAWMECFTKVRSIKESAEPVSVIKTESAPAGGKGDEPTKPATVTEAKSMKQLELEVLQLVGMSVKGLKKSQLVSVFEGIAGLRTKITTALNEDATQKTKAESLLKRLQEFEDELDAEPAPAALPPEGAPTDEPETIGTDSETELLQKVADKLTSLEGDDEAAELAAQVTDIISAMEPEVVATDVIEGKALKVAKRKINVLESGIKRITATAAIILERYHASKKISKPVAEGTDAEATAKLQTELQETKDAARDIATRYNRDMIESQSCLLQVKKPELWEANKEALQTHRTYKAFESAVNTLLDEEADFLKKKKEEAEKGKGEDDDKKAKDEEEAKKKAESAPAKTDANGNPIVEAAQEEVHPALKLVRSIRG